MRPVRVAVAGSVDDGKSTLLGRLMIDAERVFSDEVAAVETASRSVPGTTGRGREELNLAFFTDGLMLERREGITLDVAWRHLTLGKKRLLLADVPGHAELVRNMATGASGADAALLLVDAVRGIQPQTRRHLVMLSGLGVKTVVVCINKMDAVGFAQSVASSLTSELDSLATSLGIALEVIPVSALEGDGIVRRSERMPWYGGPTVAQRLEAMECVPSTRLSRGVVQLDSERDGWTAVHQWSGTLGDAVTAWPEGKGVRVLERSPLGVGRVRLDTPLPRGTLLTPLDQPPQVAAHLHLVVTWLGPGACTSDSQFALLQHGRRTSARVSGAVERVALESGLLEPTASLVAGDVGGFQVRLEGVTWFEAGGNALLVDAEGRTVAGVRFS